MGTRTHIGLGILGLLIAAPALADSTLPWVPSLTAPNFIPREVRLGSGKSFKLESRERASGLEFVKRAQYLNGVRVMGGQMLEIRGAHDKSIRSHESSVQLDVETRPTLSTATALALVGPEAHSAELLILPNPDRLSGRLLYQVKNEQGRVWIDAHSGAVIARLPSIITIAPIQVYTSEHLPFRGAHPALGPINFPLERYKAPTEGDVAADEAYRNNKLALTYFLEKHGRNSYDGAGAKLNAVIHIGAGMSNAFWDDERKLVGYGDGDGKILGSFTKAVDVAGHELTHSVVSATSKLIPIHQPGAINEGLSDFFGSLIEGKGDWVMGEDLHLTDVEVKGTRNMANPHVHKIKSQDPESGEVVEFPYPAKYTEAFDFGLDASVCSSKNDFCGVHLNSTLISHAGYRMIQQTSQEAAEKVLYLVMTQYLTEISMFADFGTAVRAACPVALGAEEAEKACTKIDATLKELEL